MRTRSAMTACSRSDIPRSRFRAAPIGNGTDGWLPTDARTAGSTAAASAKPPLKHIPMTPTPGPPAVPCRRRASARTYSAIGRSAFRAKAANSLVMQAFAIVRRA